MYKSVVCASLFCACFSGLVSAQSLSSEYSGLFGKAKQGSVVNVPGFLREDFKLIPYEKQVMAGPQFIISDDPEYIRVPEAVAIREQVQPGSVRLYVYNVNGVMEPANMDRKISVVIKNTGSFTMHLRMLKYSSQKPSGNYFQIGKQGLADYFASKAEDKVRLIAPGKSEILDSRLERNIVKYNELVHGLYEFVVDQPGEIGVVQTAPGESTIAAYERNPKVIDSRHSNAGRGLFGVSNYKVTSKGVLDTKDGVAQLMLADGKIDPWVLGYDSATGQQAKLAGNYGVMYSIDVKWKSGDGRGLALVTWNPRAADSKWCSGMAASMVVSDGLHKGGIIQIPSDRLVTKGAPEAVVIQIFPPASDGREQVLSLTYSPPGASCLPMPLVLVPIDMK